MKESVDQKKTIVGEVTFMPDGIKVPLAKSDLKGSLLDFAWRNKVKIPTSCGGGGSCGACRVLIDSKHSQVEPRNDIEQSMADDRGFTNSERLSCQISPTIGMIVELP